jgi:ATP-dependent DNA helicase RecG
MRIPWIVRNLTVGTLVSLSGKLGFWGKKRAMMFPQYEIYSGETIHTGRLVPIYPETAGITSKWLRSLVARALTLVEIEDFIAEHNFEYLKLKEAVHTIHQAKTKEEFDKAHRRLSFNEFLMLQIENNLKKLSFRQNAKAHALGVHSAQLEQFFAGLPFQLTGAQEHAIDDLLGDIKKKTPANRLLEGDVGSGKTVVAAAGIFASFVNAKKSALMAPTQILAQQHFITLRELLSPFKLRTALVTSEGVTAELGSADVVVGTHALLFQHDFVKDAAFLVIDEQHRFGVAQRAKITQLARGERAPHTLTMTATPIPRTIALTIYGDLDLSTLDELPAGRQKISTWVVPPKKREAAEKWIESQVSGHGAQVFVVCPLIEESEAEGFSQVKAVTKEYERLQKVFRHLSLALLHGRMKASEKNKVIDDFKNRKYDILVSTPVIEVGIDIPRATIMVIEAAERFGLASLYQLRGRVGRGQKKSYCLLFTESRSAKVRDRLQAVAKAKTGKELAELDLELRGPGELLGVRQSGASELKIAKWNDYELIIASRDFAEKVVANQKKYKEILDYYSQRQKAPN